MGENVPNPNLQIARSGGSRLAKKERTADKRAPENVKDKDCGRSSAWCCDKDWEGRASTVVCGGRGFVGGGRGGIWSARKKVEEGMKGGLFFSDFQFFLWGFRKSEKK